MFLIHCHNGYKSIKNNYVLIIIKKKNYINIYGTHIHLYDRARIERQCKTIQYCAYVDLHHAVFATQ